MSSIRALAAATLVLGLTARVVPGGSWSGWWVLLPLLGALACGGSWWWNGGRSPRGRLGWHRFDRALLVASLTDWAVCWGLFGIARLV